MNKVFIHGNSAVKARCGNERIDRAGGANRDPKQEKKRPIGGTGGAVPKPKIPQTKTDQGKADGVGRDPKAV